MKTKYENVESLLETGKQTGLSASERTDMWQSLHSYATFHAPAEMQVEKNSRWNIQIILRYATATAAVLFVFVGTGYASYGSLPGDALYPIKVQVIEPAVGLSYMSEEDQLSYQTTLMGRRLAEMQKLLEAKKLTEENVAALEEKVTEHSNEIGQILTNDSDESITSETKLRVLGDAVTSLRTHEYIEDTQVSKERKSQFETSEDSVSALFANEASEFAKKNPVNAVDYIADVIHGIDDDLADERVASSTVGEVTDYLEDAEEALSNGDVDKALQFTGEAKQVVELDKRIETLLPRNEETDGEKKQEGE